MQQSNCPLLLVQGLRAVFEIELNVEINNRKLRSSLIGWHWHWNWLYLLSPWCAGMLPCNVVHVIWNVNNTSTKIYYIIFKVVIIQCCPILLQKYYFDDVALTARPQYIQQNECLMNIAQVRAKWRPSRKQHPPRWRLPTRNAQGKHSRISDYKKIEWS